MAEIVTTTDSAQLSDEIISDKIALATKHKVMDKMKAYSLLNNISEACKFLAAPLITIGATLLVTAITGSNTAPNAMLIAESLLGVGAAALTAAIGTGYAASRIWQSGQFDNFEINAQSTARHLVHELQSSRTVMTEEHSQNVRADGKKWVQVTNKEQVQQLQSQT